MAEEQEYQYDIAPTDRRLDDALDAENAYQEKKEEGKPFFALQKKEQTLKKS